MKVSRNLCSGFTVGKFQTLADGAAASLSLVLKEIQTE